mmetsp:Transcript_60888/g.190950  ORF Transcript_60888/g.190950 Transcript_60888/m.190950 type:complete len:200 (-) Transcript_60888:364-963(-)
MLGHICDVPAPRGKDQDLPEEQCPERAPGVVRRRQSLAAGHRLPLQARGQPARGQRVPRREWLFGGRGPSRGPGRPCRGGAPVGQGCPAPRPRRGSLADRRRGHWRFRALVAEAGAASGPDRRRCALGPLAGARAGRLRGGALRDGRRRGALPRHRAGRGGQRRLRRLHDGVQRHVGPGPAAEEVQRPRSGLRSAVQPP